MNIVMTARFASGPEAFFFRTGRELSLAGPEFAPEAFTRLPSCWQPISLLSVPRFIAVSLEVSHTTVLCCGPQRGGKASHLTSPFIEPG